MVAGGTGADAADRDAAIVGVPGSTLVAAALGELDAGPVACADALGVGEGSAPDLVGAPGPGADVDAAHAASQTSASSSATPLVGRRNAGVKFYRLVLIISGALAAGVAVARPLWIDGAVIVALTVFVYLTLRYPKRLVFRVTHRRFDCRRLGLVVADRRASLFHHVPAAALLCGLHVIGRSLRHSRLLFVLSP